MLSEYRQRFNEFQTEWQREEFLWRSGERRGADWSRLWSEHSDLFTPARIEELRAARESIAEYRETERRGVELLIAFALEGNLQVRGREVGREIERYEASIEIDWGGGRVGTAEVEEMLASEPDGGKRRDLFVRWADAVAQVDDLREEEWRRRREGADLLGYSDLVAMHREARRVDPAALRPQAERILSRTETAYVSALAAHLPREIHQSIDDATEADLPLLRRYSRFDHYLSSEKMLGVYRELFADLGFNTASQTNLRIDAAARRAFCAPIRVPEEVRLGVQPMGGQANYGDFLFQVGRAQHAAWTSANLHPEFRRGGDPAVAEAWGLLFENLLLDGSWLTSAFGFIENDAFRRTLGLFRCMELRRDAARLLHELDFHGGAGLSPGAAVERYRERMSDAMRVQYGVSGALRGLEAGFPGANRLRARAFEAQLREFLKTQFGSRWWASRKAGETLIDLWNTGQRHSLDELARMIGLGELDFDWLLASTRF
ncbi:MAG: hypothetical protein SF339_11950 [Blastocatellia bacterium]|nr:hypothetical protein [Blastocatellia bacterium]